MAPKQDPKPAWQVEIERLNLPYHEEAQFDLTKLDGNRLVQVRDNVNYAPSETVDQYVVQMKESVFPPIIVTADDYITDGVTRFTACTKSGTKHFPAVVIEVEWTKATQARKDQLLILAATMNSMGGKRLTAGETRNAIEVMLRSNVKQEEIARRIGAALNTVVQVQREVNARAKLDRVDVEWKTLRPASLRALGVASLIDMNDLPYQALAKLAVDAGLNSREIADLAKAVKETGADHAGMELINNNRTEMLDRIADHNLTGNGHPPLSLQLRRNLGFINKHADGNEYKLVEHSASAEVRKDHAKAIRTAIGVLQAVLNDQQE